MAVAELIGAAIGVLLLVIVAYVLVGSTLTTAEIVATAQKDVTLLQESRIHTLFSLSNTANTSTTITTDITNSGTELIGDLTHTDVLVYDAGSGYQYYKYSQGSATPGTWTVTNTYSEFLHPYELDPGEKYQIQVNLVSSSPQWFQVTTANGVYASAFI